MAKVFVSYSRKDITFAKRLTAELQKCELDFWIDWEGIPPSVDWWREIEKGIEEADIFLFLISPDSARSKVCGQEIEVAVKNAKRIIPLIVRDIQGEEAPGQLGHLNWLFFRESDDFDAALNKLLTAIQTDYEWAATHRRLQVKALDWERNNKESGFLLRGLDLLDAEQDLAMNTSKEPHPTDLQRKYVFESRKATDRQRRTASSIAIGGVAVLAVLTVMAIVMAVRATQQAKTALARQLVSQAQLLNTNRSSKQLTASLLSIQSMKLYPNGDAANFLLNNNLESKLVATIEAGGELQSFTLSPDGKYIASSVCNKANETAACIWSLSIWDAQSGKEVDQFTQKNGHSYNFVFSPDSKYIVFEQCTEYDENSGSCVHKPVHVFEIQTGTELANLDNTSNEPFRLSPDGKHIAITKCDQKDETGMCTQSSVILWYTSTGKEFTRIKDIKSDGYSSIAFSPNWKHIATEECYQPGESEACSQRIIHVREIPSGKEVALITKEGDFAFYSGFAFSPNGKHIIANNSEEAVIWESATGKKVFHFRTTFVAFSPNGEHVIAVSGTTTEVWGVSTGKDVLRFTDNAGFSTNFAFSPDGKYAVMGNLAGRLNVWDITTGRVAVEIPYYVMFASFSPDGRNVVVADDEGTAHVLEIATSKEISRMTHDKNVRTAIFSPDGQFVVTADYYGIVRVWNPLNNLKDFYIPYMTEGSIEIGVITDEFIISPTCEKYDQGGFCVERAISRWKIPSGSKIGSIPLIGSIPSSYESNVLSPDGRYIASVKCQQWADRISLDCFQSSIQIWDTATGQKLGHILQGGNRSPNEVVFSPKGSFVASLSSVDAEILIWDPVTGNELNNFDPGHIVTFTPDEKYLVIQQDTEIYVLNISTGKKFSHFIIDRFFKSFAISPDGRYIAFGYDDDVMVWNIATAKKISHMAHDKVENFNHKLMTGIWSVAFSPDGNYVVTGGGDLTARVWKTTTGKEVARMPHEDAISNVAFSPDGKFVASLSFDHVLRVWNALTEQEMTRNKIDGCNGCLPYSLFSFSPDGRHIIAGGHILMWQPEDIIANACTVVPRNLTRAEWAQYIGDAIPYEAVCEDLPIETEGSLTPTAISTP